MNNLFNYNDLGKVLDPSNAKIDILEKYLDKKRFASAKRFYDKFAQYKYSKAIKIICKHDSLLITDGSNGYVDRSPMPKELVEAYADKFDISSVLDDGVSKKIETTSEKLEDILKRYEILVSGYYKDYEHFVCVELASRKFIAHSTKFLLSIFDGANIEESSVVLNTKTGIDALLIKIDEQRLMFTLNVVYETPYFKSNGKFVDTDKDFIAPSLGLQKVMLDSAIKTGDEKGYREAFAEYWHGVNFNNVLKNKPLAKVPEPIQVDKLYKIFPYEELRPLLNCVYYDPTGYAVKACSYVMIYSKDLYKSEFADKVINRFGQENKTDGTYPNWESLIPPEKSLLEVKQFQIDKFVEVAKKYKSINKEIDNNYNNPVGIELIEGRWCNPITVVLISDLLSYLDKNPKCYYDGKKTAIITDGRNTILFVLADGVPQNYVDNKGGLHVSGSFSKVTEALKKRLIKKIEKLDKTNSKLKH